MKQFNLRWPVLAICATLFLALMAFSAGVALGQATTGGNIVGTVTDSTGALIAGATVTVTDPATKSVRTTVSNKQGQYIIPDVPPGTYNVKTTKDGFSTDEIIALTVSVGEQTTANFKMAVGAADTTIEVTTSGSDLQTMNAGTGTSVDPAMVNSLPTIGREVATFTTMQPGVTPGGNVAGTTTDQATFTLDGGNNTFDMDGTSATYTQSFASSTTGGFFGAAQQGTMPMPQDSIEEFKVTTTGQTADFNNSSGSQTTAVTKRGRDKWTGTLYEYYLDNNFNGNTWQNNFPNQNFCGYNNPTASYCLTPTPAGVNPGTPTSGYGGAANYSSKPSYHYSRFGVAAGGPIAPKLLGGKTYLFANFEGFRYPQAATYERTVPSYEYLQLGQLTFPGNLAGCTYNGSTLATSTCSSAQLKAADPRGIGMNPTLTAFYNNELPVAPVGDGGSTGFNGASYSGVFDTSCGSLSTSYCDGKNTIGYKGTVVIPESSNFFVTRVDHDFGSKWHLMASYRFYKLNYLTSNQVDIGGVLPGDKIGVPTAVAPRPQEPWYLVVGLTTNISSSLTNDFHYSYLRNYWNWKDDYAPAQVAGAGGAIEPLGENTTTVLSPYNVNAQSIRTRTWDGKDNFFSDNLTKLKGNHLIQMGGQFQHNFNFFSRTDNGSSINFTPTYQIGDTGGGGNIAYAGSATVSATNPCTSTNSTYAAGSGLGCVGAGTANNARILDTYYGLVTDTQVASTYSNTSSGLSLNAPLTPVTGHASIPYYNIYVTDTWHVSPALTLNGGISYAVEMPPTDRNGNESLFTDVAGNTLSAVGYLASRQSAAFAGQVYNPEIGWAEIHNVLGNRKYPYNPFYGGFSPRVSATWAPKFKNEALNKIFGDGATALRAGYGRIFGRVNGDAQVLPLLAAPGLIVGTTCKYAQASATSSSGVCNQLGYTDKTAYRFGVDGLSPVLASAPLSNPLPQPFHPGFDGPAISSSSGVDTSLRPNDVDTFNVSIQRQINRKMLVEVGYIGRLIHHEFNQVNPNSVPYMMTLGSQSFESAYLALETALGCTTSASQCAKNAVPTTIAAQPFFEYALGGITSGTTSAFCAAYGGNCTLALLHNATMVSDLRAQKVFSMWQSLDNNTNGIASSATNPQFLFARSLMGTADSNATFGAGGQVTAGLTQDTPIGYSNYNGGYVSFKTSGFRGLTLQENLTYSKALGLNAANQSASGASNVDNFNLSEQYGRQPFDQKIIFNTFIVYQTPWYAHEEGVIGRFAGGWTFSPVLTAGTGVPLQCVTNNSGQSFGGNDGSTLVSTENCIFTAGYNGGYQTHRGVLGGTDPLAVGVGTAVHPGSTSAAVNMFTNPVAVFDSVRPPVLGLDAHDGGTGPISGLPYLNLDFSIKKKIVVYKQYSLELTGVFQNVMNHLDFASPSLSLQAATSWGVTKTQGNTPRQIQMGVRAYF
jgi:hypothetical protein